MAATVGRLYDEEVDAQNAVRDLVQRGFKPDQVSLVAHDAAGVYARYHGEYIPNEEVAQSAGTGSLLGGVGGFIAGLAAVAIPGIGPALAAGPIASAILGAGTGVIAGGLVGAMVERGLNQDTAEFYAEGVRRGSTLVTIEVEDDQIDLAQDILNHHHPVDLAARVEQWREAGWTSFDPEAGS